MNLLTLGSAVIATVGLLATLLLSRKCRCGWLISILTSLLAVPYDLATRQYGFVATGIVGLAIAIRGYRTWGRTGPAGPPPGS